MKKRLSSILLILFTVQSMMAQLISLGLVEESNIENKKSEIKRGYSCFIPEVKFIGGSMLYAGTPTGLYKCGISNLDAVQWEKLPITDDIIEDFEIRGDTVIVLSRKELLLSVDGGMTVEQRLSDSVFVDGYHSIRELHSIAVHPNDAKRIYVANQLNYLSYTNDFGKSWSRLGSLGLTSLCYSPHDSNHLIGFYNHPVYDETSTFISRDGGLTWTCSNNENDKNPFMETFRIAFHPTDENRLATCGGIGLSLSYDGGTTWEQMMYTNGKWQYPVASIYDVTYDARNPNTLYGANMYTGLELDSDTMKVIRSTDGGLTWSEFFAEPMANKGNLLRMAIKDNFLALYTSANGIYLLDVDAVEASIDSVMNDKDIPPYYDLQGRPVANPTRGIYIKDGKKVIIGQ